MSDPARDTLVGIGELLWDCFGDSRRPGGAPANVAFHARQLGTQAAVLSRVGRDALGDELAAHLSSCGLETTFIQRDANHPTGTVTVELSQKDHPQYVIHENVAWDHLAFDAPAAQLLGRATAICFGTLAQRSPASRAAIRAAVNAAPDALRIYDVNIRPPWYSRDVIEWSLRAASVVKLNADEVAVLACELELPNNDADDLASHLHDRCNVDLVCLTRGGLGCVLYARGEKVTEKGRPREVVDTVGAGDAFTAGLAFALRQSWPLARVAQFANEVGGLVATRPGAMPPLRDEFAALIEDFRSRAPR